MVVDNNYIFITSLQMVFLYFNSKVYCIVVSGIFSYLYFLVSLKTATFAFLCFSTSSISPSLVIIPLIFQVM